MRATRLVDEITAVDDGSSDDIPTILARLQSRHTPHPDLSYDGAIAIWTLIKYRFFYRYR